MNDLISIIIPVYNSIDKIKKTLNSLKIQTSNSFEVIFIDDHSSDGTYKFLKEELQQYIFSHKLIRNLENKGAGLSRNVGLSHVSGSYILFLDSDDYLREDTIEILQDEIKKKNRPDIIAFNYIYESRNKKYKRSILPNISCGKVSIDDALSYMNGSTCGKIYKSSLILTNNIKFPSLKRNEDIPFTKISVLYANSIYLIDEYLYYYVNEKTSLMNNRMLLDENNTISAYFMIEKVAIRLDKKDKIKRIFLIELMYSSVYNKILNKKSNREIKKHIEKYSVENEWINWIKLYNIPKLQKKFLKNIYFKRINRLRILVYIRESLKKISGK